MASALSNGYYVLTTWAAAGDVSGATVRANYKARYGEPGVEGLGQAAQGINFGALQKQFQERIDRGDLDVLNPPSSAILSAILAVGGKTPSVLAAVESGVGDAVSSTARAAETVASGALSGLKYAAILALVGGGFYILWKFNALGKVRRA